MEIVNRMKQALENISKEETGGMLSSSARTEFFPIPSPVLSGMVIAEMAQSNRSRHNVERGIKHAERNRRERLISRAMLLAETEG